MAKFPEIGELNKRITLLKPAKLPDEGGGRRVSYQDVVDVRASVEPISSREFLFAQQARAEVTHRIRIRFRPDVKNDWRIRFETAQYQVDSIIDMGGARRFLELLCHEYPENE